MPENTWVNGVKKPNSEIWLAQLLWFDFGKSQTHFRKVDVYGFAVGVWLGVDQTQQHNDEIWGFAGVTVAFVSWILMACGDQVMSPPRTGNCLIFQQMSPYPRGFISACRFTTYILPLDLSEKRQNHLQKVPVLRAPWYFRDFSRTVKYSNSPRSIGFCFVCFMCFFFFADSIS